MKINAAPDYDVQSPVRHKFLWKFLYLSQIVITEHRLLINDVALFPEVEKYFVSKITYFIFYSKKFFNFPFDFDKNLTSFDDFPLKTLNNEYEEHEISFPIWKSLFFLARYFFP